jgi:hypothetical protein
VLGHPANRPVHVPGLDLERVPDPSGPFGGEQRRPRAGKAVEDDVSFPGAVEDRVGDEPNGFDRRVQGERLVALGPKTVHAGIAPHVGSGAPVFAQLDVVHVRGRSHLEDVDELMLRAVEGAHAGVGLHPDAQVFALAVDPPASGEELGAVSPVHADEVERTIGAVGGMAGKGGLEEGCELGLAHLAARHRELGMTRPAKSGDVALDAHVVGRVDEDEARPSLSQQAGIGVFEEGIAAEEAVRADGPEVTRARDDGSVRVKAGRGVGGIGPVLLLAAFDQEIDLGRLESDHGEIEVEVDLGEALQLDREEVFVPACILGESVVGDDVGPDLGLGKVFELEGGNRLEAELLRGADAAVAGDDGAVPIDQDRVREAEGLDRPGDLADLFFAVGAGVSAPRGQRRDRAGLDLQGARCRRRLERVSLCHDETMRVFGKGGEWRKLSRAGPFSHDHFAFAFAFGFTFALVFFFALAFTFTFAFTGGLRASWACRAT